MSASTPKKLPTKHGQPTGNASRAKPSPTSQLRAQTRRVLSKHYRAKYGVK